ncbi:hypothetical protein [Streptomyces griseoruber]|uniref:hypothetical protein n=1 Tax=Streptomyces griseoruber TaxID=1943 RepID=UPI0012FEA4E4|nr:hypothetical protein [Streptomyces griseoruber]
MMRPFSLLLVSFLLIFTAYTEPASANWNETNWQLTGGAARTIDTPGFTSDGVTHQYRAVRGTDNGVWVSHNNGAAARIPDALTISEPEIITMYGQTYIFVVGTDRGVWWSRRLNPEGTSWSPFARVPGNPDTSVAVSVVADGNYHFSIFATRSNGMLERQRGSVATSITPSFDGYWLGNPNAGAAGAPSCISIPDQITYGQSYDYCGFPKFVCFNSTEKCITTPCGIGTSSNASDSEFYARTVGCQWPEAECRNVSVVRGGIDGSLTWNTVDPNYRYQQEMAVGCISPNNGELYVNRSSDGGHEWTGFRHPSDGPGASDSRPSLHADGGNIYAALRWDADRDGRFPENSIVEKRL